MLDQSYGKSSTAQPVSVPTTPAPPPNTGTPPPQQQQPAATASANPGDGIASAIMAGLSNSPNAPPGGATTAQQQQDPPSTSRGLVDYIASVLGMTGGQ